MALDNNFKTNLKDLVGRLGNEDVDLINQTIFKRSFQVSDIANSHNVVTGARDGNSVPIIGMPNAFDSMPAGDENSCNLNECDDGEDYSAKEWSIGEYNCRNAICLRNVDEEFRIFWNFYNQRLDNPLEAPDHQAYIEFLTRSVQAKVRGTAWRTAYFGDTGSSNSLIKNNDGFLVQADAGDGEKIEVDYTKTGEDLLKEIYGKLADAYDYSQSQLWGGAENLVWKMSYKMASTLVKLLNKAGDTSMYDCGCINPDGVVSARRFNVEGLTLFGIPVEAHREIDLSHDAVGADGEPYYAILTPKDNLLLGVNLEDRMEMLDIFFNRKDRTIYVDSIVATGSSIPVDEYAVITPNVQGGDNN